MITFFSYFIIQIYSINIHQRQNDRFNKSVFNCVQSDCHAKFTLYNKECSHREEFVQDIEYIQKLNVLANLPIFIVHQETSYKRKELLLKMFEKYHIDTNKYVHFSKAMNTQNVDFIETDTKKVTFILDEKDGRRKFLNNKKLTVVQAITFSHLLALKRAYEYGSEYSIIAEDDVTLDLSPYWHKCDGDHPIAAIIREANFNYPKWGIIQISVNDVNSPLKYLPSLKDAYSTQHRLVTKHPPYLFGAFGYIVNKKYLSSVLSHFFMDNYMDIVKEYPQLKGIDNATIINIEKCDYPADYLVYNDCGDSRVFENDIDILTSTRPLFSLDLTNQYSEHFGYARFDPPTKNTLKFIVKNIYDGDNVHSLIHGSQIMEDIIDL